MPATPALSGGSKAGSIAGSIKPRQDDRVPSMTRGSGASAMSDENLGQMSLDPVANAVKGVIESLFKS
jgi:hypothetical protein